MCHRRLLVILSGRLDIIISTIYNESLNAHELTDRALLQSKSFTASSCCCVLCS